MHTQLAVLGGGPGGYAAAFRAADLGMEVTIVEANSRLGGTCLLHGCIPSKTLLHVTATIGQAKEMEAWGVKYASPEIHVESLRARVAGVLQGLAGGLAMLARQRKVRVLNARGAFRDSQTLRLEAAGTEPLETDTLTYDHLVLATGSLSTIPTAMRTGLDRVMDSSGALALRDVPASLLVIGGGYIGLELGSVYAQLGSRVSVVEMTGNLLAGADRDLVRPLQKRLEKLFAAIRLNTTAAAMTGAGDAVEVFFRGEGAETRERFDRVLLAVGRRPNSQGLGLENTRVQVDGRGYVQVDGQRRTADSHIFAVGDVAGEPLLAHKAMHEGKVAAETIHGGPAAFDAKAIPAVVFTDPEVAWAGLTEDEAKAKNVSVEISRYPWAASGRAQGLGRPEGMTKLLADPQTGRILGAGIVGVAAGDLISEAVLAIEMGCTVRDLARAVHPHPTLSETISGAAEMNLGLATEIYRPKKK